MNLNEVKARTELGLYPQSDEYMKWLIAEVENLRAIRRLTSSERKELEACRESIDLYKHGKQWYPLQLRQAELLLAYVDQLTGQEPQQETPTSSESISYNYPPGLAMSLRDMRQKRSL